MDAARAQVKLRIRDWSDGTVIALLVALALVCVAPVCVAGLLAAGGGHLGLGPAGVDVDVFLAGELGDRLYDLVGHRPQEHGVGLAAVAGELERLAELDPGPDPEVRPDRGGRL